MQKLSFLLAGVFVAALIVGVFLLAGTLEPKYEPFGPNQHTTCGQPVTMRAEGYNLLGGTRYGRDADDPGDDIPLANVDLCDPFLEILPSGEERLWFWLEVEVIGQVFPYAAWGLPWEDVMRGNPADERNPIDPIWTPESVYGLAHHDYTGSEWRGRRAEVCSDWDESGLKQFFNSEHGFTVPVGTTQAGWVCLTFSTPEHPHRMPEALSVTTSPRRARITRWVDALIWIHVAPDTEEGGHEIQAAVQGREARCRYAEARRPGSILPGGACEISPGP